MFNLKKKKLGAWGKLSCGKWIKLALADSQGQNLKQQNRQKSDFKLHVRKDLLINKVKWVVISGGSRFSLQADIQTLNGHL